MPRPACPAVNRAMSVTETSRQEVSSRVRLRPVAQPGHAGPARTRQIGACRASVAWNVPSVYFLDRSGHLHPRHGCHNRLGHRRPTGGKGTPMNLVASSNAVVSRTHSSRFAAFGSPGSQGMSTGSRGMDG
jgi:hypothetical protein